MCWRALAFTLISDLRTSTILQEQIPWQGQALKHLMSSPPFAFKHVCLRKDQAHSRAKHPQAFFCSEQRAVLCICSSVHPCGSPARLWAGLEQCQSGPWPVCSSRPTGSYAPYIRACFRWLEIVSRISVKSSLINLLSFLSMGSLHWFLEL